MKRAYRITDKQIQVKSFVCQIQPRSNLYTKFELTTSYHSWDNLLKRIYGQTNRQRQKINVSIIFWSRNVEKWFQFHFFSISKTKILKRLGLYHFWSMSSLQSQGFSLLSTIKYSKKLLQDVINHQSIFLSHHLFISSIIHHRHLPDFFGDR